jgi:pimeloyl-ACP methyl ester carboxylesterase
MSSLPRIERVFLLLTSIAITTAITAGDTENAIKEAGTPFVESIKTVPVGDIRMAYQVLGQGEPLVMITGLNAAMDLWDRRFLDGLSSKYQVIIFDNRGVGYTGASSANFSIEQFANDTARLMDALGIERANVLGYSMGSLVAQELAINHPEKIKRLILFAGNCGGSQAIQPAPEIFGAVPDLSDPSNLTQQELNGFFEIMFPPEWLTKNPDVYKTFSQAKESSTPENMMRQTMAVVFWPGSYDRLDRIKAPTMIVAGMKDAMIPPANSLILAERINGSRMVRFENAGHGLIFQYPDEMARIVADFIEISAQDSSIGSSVPA